MWIKKYVTTLAIFLLCDGVWLGLVARGLYASQLGYLMTAEVVWAAALAFYLLFAAGLVEFVVTPALKRGGWQAAALRGAFFGLISYATYDLTNLATIRDWPLIVTMVDLAWGAVLGGLTSALTVAILRCTKPVTR